MMGLAQTRNNWACVGAPALASGSIPVEHLRASGETLLEAIFLGGAGTSAIPRRESAGGADIALHVGDPWPAQRPPRYPGRSIVNRRVHANECATRPLRLGSMSHPCLRQNPQVAGRYQVECTNEIRESSPDEPDHIVDGILRLVPAPNVEDEALASTYPTKGIPSLLSGVNDPKSLHQRLAMNPIVSPSHRLRPRVGLAQCNDRSRYFFRLHVFQKVRSNFRVKASSFPTFAIDLLAINFEHPNDCVRHVFGGSV